MVIMHRKNDLLASDVCVPLFNVTEIKTCTRITSVKHEEIQVSYCENYDARKVPYITKECLRSIFVQKLYTHTCNLI